MGLLDDAIREHLELKRRHGADSNEVARQEREILGSPGAAPADERYDGPDAEVDATLAPGVLEDEPAPLDVAPEPLAGSPLAEPGEAPAEAAPPAGPVDDLFPGTGELLAAAAESTPADAPVPERPAARPEPAPADADSETVARSGARRLSDEELAAWRRRLSERADRLAAQRPAADAPATPAAESPAQAAPPAAWSGSEGATEPPAVAPRVPVDFFDAGDAESAFAPAPAPEPEVPDETPQHDMLDETPDFLEETPEHDRMWFEQKPPRDFEF